jgi:hypothetical protein
MRELAALAETAGARVLDGLLQRRPHPDPSTYLGSGKAEELRHVEPASVFVAHPIQDRTDDEMRALADGAIEEILRSVTAR